jgi:hypothetical protein
MGDPGEVSRVRMSHYLGGVEHARVEEKRSESIQTWDEEAVLAFIRAQAGLPAPPSRVEPPAATALPDAKARPPSAAQTRQTSPSPIAAEAGGKAAPELEPVQSTAPEPAAASTSSPPPESGAVPGPGESKVRKVVLIADAPGEATQMLGVGEPSSVEVTVDIRAAPSASSLPVKLWMYASGTGAAPSHASSLGMTEQDATPGSPLTVSLPIEFQDAGLYQIMGSLAVGDPRQRDTPVEILPIDAGVLYVN